MEGALGMVDCSGVRVLVLTGYGINCDYETAHAFAMDEVGATAERVHVNDLLDDGGRAAVQLHDYDIFVVPGGFSFGDNIAAGRVLANKLRVHLAGPLTEFVEDGKLVLGICNGFQVLAKMGLLPATRGLCARQDATVTYNDSGRFEDRWVHLQVEPESPCVFTRGLKGLYFPVRHGEGKVIARSPRLLREWEDRQLIPLRYVAPDGSAATYPWNPNGSVNDIAGLCDPTGRIFGLMPHPEAYLYRTNHPRWTRERVPAVGQGVALFRNAVRHAVRRQRQHWSKAS